MGAYGGTSEASKSYFGGPPCETIVAGDINGDCTVDFLDFRIMALHWLGGNEPNYRVEDGVEYYLEVDKFVYDLGEDIHMVYLVLLASGVRLSEAVIFLNTLDKQKFIKMSEIAVKYPFTLLRGRKKVFYIYLPQLIAENLKRTELTRCAVSSYAKRHQLIRPKYIRKFVAQKMFQLGIDPLVIDFIQGRTSRSVLARHYLNLSYLADEQYSRYAKWFTKVRLYL